MHFHASASQAMALLPIVLLINLAMRLLAGYMAKSANPTVSKLGSGLAFMA